MEQIVAVQLGNITNKRFLNGLIPNEWKEKVYEHDKFWACKCERNDQITSENYTEKEIEFNDICKKIEKEFNEHLMEIYSITSAGICFIIYLRKMINKK